MLENYNLFEGTKPLKITKPIRLIELFAGIGAQAKALENLGVPFEHYRICEFDKYPVKSYNAVHGTNFDVSDITKINASDLNIVETDIYTYILTYSFPCTDLSLAGKQAGMQKGSGTRSGLLWEVERLIKEMKELPQILLMENVTQVHGSKNIEDFQKWIEFLQSYGYCSKWCDLNAKDFGIPQNRNRTFMVSWQGDFYYEFPQKIPLKLKLKDMLDDTVDEKYYLSDDVVSSLVKDTSIERERERENCDCQQNINTERDGSSDSTSGTGLQGVWKRFPRSECSDVSHSIRCGGRNTADTTHSWDLVYG